MCIRDRYVINTVVNSINGGAESFGKLHDTYDILVKTVLELFSAQPFGTKILMAGIILIVIAIISGLFMFLMRQTIIVMSRRIEFEQKNEIYRHYQQLDTQFYKTHSTGDLMNRISDDVSKVRMYTGPAIMYFINPVSCTHLDVDKRQSGKWQCMELCATAHPYPQDGSLLLF